MSGFVSRLPLAAKIFATASALVASAPRPYTVSVGNATSPPRRRMFTASVISLISPGHDQVQSETVQQTSHSTAAEQVDELAKLLLVEVRDGGAGHSIVIPAQEVVAVVIGGGRLRVREGRRPGVEIDHVLMPLVDDGGDGTVAEVVEPAADEGETVGGEVDDRRVKVELAVEPRLHGVLVGGDDVEQV